MKRYIIKKSVMANSLSEALQIEKKTPADYAWIDDTQPEIKQQESLSGFDTSPSRYYYSPYLKPKKKKKNNFYMKFTKKQKNEYLDNLALRTQQGIWMTEMAILKDAEQLEQKKALLAQTEDKQERKHLEEKIAHFEKELQDENASIQLGAEDLELIERFRKQ